MTMFEQFNEQLPVHYIYLNVHDPKKGPPGLLRCHFKNVFRPFLKRSLTYITFNSVYNIQFCVFQTIDIPKWLSSKIYTKWKHLKSYGQTFLKKQSFFEWQCAHQKAAQNKTEQIVNLIFFSFLDQNRLNIYNQLQLRKKHFHV